jgi:hypothetical protein
LTNSRCWWSCARRSADPDGIFRVTIDLARRLGLVGILERLNPKPMHRYAHPRIPMEVRGQLAVRFEVLLPHLNERQQRLALAVEARLLGHGGVRAVAQVAGVSETTVRKGVVELEAGEAPLPPGRVRGPGGGRKSAAQQDPISSQPCRRWSSRTSGVIRNLRCGGRRRCGTWPRS